jgi:hypothetical protein
LITDVINLRWVSACREGVGEGVELVAAEPCRGAGAALGGADEAVSEVDE